VGALIGYVTNTIAVMMLFRPHAPRRVLGIRFQGLIPKRQPALARKIGEVVGQHLLDKKDLVAALHKVDLRKVVGELIDSALERKVADFRKIPMVGAFITPERIASIRDSIVDSVLENEAALADKLERVLDENLDVAHIVETKVAGFPTTRLEQLVLDVARKELRAIEVWGAVLGALIGLIQVFVLHLFNAT
ncbi:MAG: DUF445 family protein, partial [Planctomycetes bacterium]|nr:DUF445 family protein [Planctomycetota bacterium]